MVLFWDYDTQWGADRSRSGEGPKAWGPEEFTNTERLLTMLERYRVVSCFAVVAAAAKPGARPYHDPEQIRAIHHAGHEVGCHSLHHDWLPGLAPDRLRENLRRSREVLEACIGAPVETFVPPYNQPFHYPAALSFSQSERAEAGPDHLGFGGLCRELKSTGYRFCRGAYRPLPQRVMERVLRRSVDWPGTLKRIAGISCLRLNAGCGFSDAARQMVRRCAREGGYAVVYGHPHSLSTAGPQSFACLEALLAEVRELVGQQKLQVVQPRELVNHV
ncbi:MAG: polysaccharide deacetylase family protein [Acidobacteria bacterium]|jgi:peptidoglycan/xylan/chitin deacetylase (PgdA/CDA1 family)|nr:polysaccharide deacetylase family protein [Acidobacteriota bacterium]